MGGGGGWDVCEGMGKCWGASEVGVSVRGGVRGGGGGGRGLRGVRGWGGGGTSWVGCEFGGVYCG